MHNIQTSLGMWSQILGKNFWHYRAKKVDTEIRAFDGSTPLHLAAWKGHSKVCSLLLKNGLDKNSRTARGNMPLHFAAQEGHLDVCRIFVEAGAEINTANNDGITPIKKATQNKHSEVAIFLHNTFYKRKIILQSTNLHQEKKMKIDQ